MAFPEIREIAGEDRDWVRRVTTEHWGGPAVVVHGEVFVPETLAGLVAIMDGERAGMLTFDVRGDALEIVTLVSLREGLGIGSALLTAAVDAGRRRGCRRVRVVTTNDNLRALGFYQRKGFRLVRLSPGAVEESRRAKSEIPMLGENGIPIRDEIELELRLGVES